MLIFPELPSETNHPRGYYQLAVHERLQDDDLVLYLDGAGYYKAPPLPKWKYVMECEPYAIAFRKNEYRPLPPCTPPPTPPQS